MIENEWWGYSHCAVHLLRTEVNTYGNTVSTEDKSSWPYILDPSDFCKVIDHQCHGLVCIEARQTMVHRNICWKILRKRSKVAGYVLYICRFSSKFCTSSSKVRWKGVSHNYSNTWSFFKYVYTYAQAPPGYSTLCD